MFLEHFFISKVRVQILKLFFFHFDESYHVRAVVKETGEEVNAVRRELKNMEKAGLLTSQSEGNKIVYTVNKDYPLFADFLSLVHKEFGLGAQILKARDQIGDIKYAMITRALSKKKKFENINVDFMIVGDINLQVLGTAVKEAEKDLKREIQYTAMTAKEFDFRKKKRDAFLLNILAGSKIMVIGDEDEMLSTDDQEKD